MNQAGYDLCVIGGGINGAGIARDAAGRGLSVVLAEQGDLAAATSSASTKLIHGGLRYLEYFEFGLVREALAERETLLSLAPHLIRPMSFILPYEQQLRPAWMIRLGLFLYDHLASRKKLSASQSVRFKDGPLEERYSKGFSYADCRVDDARLVILNAVDAAEKGAHILTRTRCTKIVPAGDHWTVHFENHPSCTARMIVNAGGPWVYDILESSGLAAGKPHIRLVKGSHITVKRFLPGDDAYILQQPDRRIVFAIPYEQDFTLIGTTDVEYTGDPATPAIDRAEIDYLCAAVNRSFRNKIEPSDIVWTYSGVRPLLDDRDENPSAVTRDYKLVLDDKNTPPLLSVFGGKITTYRHLAEEAIDKLTGKPGWTANAPLPGGEFSDFDQFLTEKKAVYKHLPADLTERCAHAYGTRMDMFLAEGDLGGHFGDNVYEAEIRYMIDHEWAQTAEDILWRRTKLGLHVSPPTVQNLEDYLKKPRINTDTHR